jgi:prepilin-type N-terminal cleavage/methylation domain-containing protein
MTRQRANLMPRDRRRRPAFTLIELIAVIVIVAVLAAVAAPTLHTFGDTAAIMAAKTLVHDLTFARQRALATGTSTWVVFDSGAATWSLLAEDPSNPGRAAAALITDPATNSSYIHTLGADAFVGVALTSAAFDGDVEIGFDWLAQPLNATEAALATQGVVTLTGNHVVTIAVGSGQTTYVAP